MNPDAMVACPKARRTLDTFHGAFLWTFEADAGDAGRVRRALAVVETLRPDRQRTSSVAAPEANAIQQIGVTADQAVAALCITGAGITLRFAAPGVLPRAVAAVAAAPSGVDRTRTWLSGSGTETFDALLDDTLCWRSSRRTGVGVSGNMPKDGRKG